jgi:hypothetical protein
LRFAFVVLVSRRSAAAGAMEGFFRSQLERA